MKMSTDTDILDLFKVMVITDKQRQSVPYLDMLEYGYVLDFEPTPAQMVQLKNASKKKLDIKTLFTVEERKTADPFALIQKQLLHYIEVYGLGMPGLFDLEVTNGSIITVDYIKGIGKSELADTVKQKLYVNAPVESAEKIKNIINEYSIAYDVNRVANNELRVILFNAQKDTFVDGDDAVRYLVYKATGKTLLIKSTDVVNAMASYAMQSQDIRDFMERHETVLATVFKRHRKLIMALKTPKQSNVINRISRLSNKLHAPLKPSLNKELLTRYLNGTSTDFSLLGKVSIRDKFKYLNLLAHKKAQVDVDAFNIRNGKIFIKSGRKTFDKKLISSIEKHVLDSIAFDLTYLKGRTILLDKDVDYGLPISAKQVMGRLPFGTTVSSNGDEISSGVYWHNNGGARDLDLSAVDTTGTRVGWGAYSGYANKSIIFSGDVTSAHDGAMEFMTSKTGDYGLFVNIYSGNNGSECEIVVGDKDDNNTKWIKNTYIREKIKLDSRMSGIGFVKGKTFVVYPGRMSNSRISGSNQPILKRGLGEWWTVARLFDAIGIKYDVEEDASKTYDYDMTYAAMTYNSLERMFG